MTSPWVFAEEAQSIPAEAVTLVCGTTFAILDAAGDLAAHGPQGLFVADTRVCSRAQLVIDGHPVDPLTVGNTDPATATFAGRSADTSIFVRRTWTITTGAACDVELISRARHDRTIDVELLVAADLADLFAVKDGRAPEAAVATTRTLTDSELRIEDLEGRRGLVARITRSDGEARADSERGLAWRVPLAARGRWRCRVELIATREGDEVGGEPEQAWASAHRRCPAVVSSDIPGLELSVSTSLDDLDALRLVDHRHPDDVVVAAGAPWFMTLFGRDSLLTSWMALPVDPDLGLATAKTLARLQGRRTDPPTEEQPGRILHEVRFGAGASLSLSDAERYYGSVDATPLFVMLVHQLWRWGTPWDELEPLLPAVDAAVRWIDGPGDPDGDGFVEYARATEQGLRNQGWKDSWDAISYADGDLAEPPIALAEVQAYAHAALLAASELSAVAGDAARAGQHTARAARLADDFDAAFWLPDRSTYALALDHDKRPVDSEASHLGHLLWCGIVPPEKVAAVADALVAPPLRSGWGIRTLATSMHRFDPLGYHTGSVWPHDTALAVAGLRRAGRARDAAALAADLLRAASALGGRLPELFSGLTPEQFPVPVPYPASCSPQAWASACPLLLVRALLGLEVDVPRERISLDPVLPEGCGRLHASGLRIAGHEVSIQIDGDAVAFRGLPQGMAVELLSRSDAGPARPRAPREQLGASG